MKGLGIIIVGATGTGKSTLVKKKLELADINARFVFDVNAEYGGLFSHKLIDDFEQFASLAVQCENALIVFEETTAFISNKGSNEKMRKVLVQKRHKHNTIFLVFHSMRAVPRDLYDLCNYVYLLRTNDDEKLIASRFDNPLLTSAFNQLKNSREKYPVRLVPIQPPADHYI